MAPTAPALAGSFSATVEEILGAPDSPEVLLKIPAEAGLTLTPGATLAGTVIPGPPGSGITNIVLFTLTASP